MTIVIERYTDNNGNIAYIQQEKDCKAYTLIICKPIVDNPAFATTLFRRNYSSLKTARQAMRKNGFSWAKHYPR